MVGEAPKELTLSLLHCRRLEASRVFTDVSYTGCRVHKVHNIQRIQNSGQQWEVVGGGDKGGIVVRAKTLSY